MPASATRLQGSQSGRPSASRAGAWRLLSRHLVGRVFLLYDATGGPYASDPVVAWAICAFSWQDGAPVQVGTMTGVLPPGSTVAAGECFAVARLCSRLVAEADCTTDCRAAPLSSVKPLALGLGLRPRAKNAWPG